MIKFYGRYIKHFFCGRNFFIALAVVFFLHIVNYVTGRLGYLPHILLFTAFLLLVVEYFLLFYRDFILHAKRSMDEKLSNGETNTIGLSVASEFFLPLKILLIDELPFKFQKRDNDFKFSMPAYSVYETKYYLRPTERGLYNFGSIIAMVSTPLNFAVRRIVTGELADVPVYPSILAMKKYELLAADNRFTVQGSKLVHKIGQSYEFEHIRDFRTGDDIRNINWKASARRNELMLNTYIDEKSQDVYNVIDVGRSMNITFEGMSLLDYAVNSSLVLSNVILQKGDKAGLVTFSKKVFSFAKAVKYKTALKSISENLFNCEYDYTETDFKTLYMIAESKIRHRSLFMIYTNFESEYSLKRNISYLKQLARRHYLIVIIFNNKDMEDFLLKKSSGIKDVYKKSVAEKLLYEKELVIRELQSHNIQTHLVNPDELNVSVINHYIQAKAMRVV